MTDLVIGMGDDTTANRHAAFLRSVQKSGFKGEVKIFMEDPLPWHPVVDRWKLISDYIDKGHYNRVIACDTFDVVFQSNPFDWLDEFMVTDLILTSEEKKFKDCEGNRRGMLDAFPQYWEKVQDREIINAGVIAGRADAVAQIAGDIYNLCQQDARLPKFTPKFQDRLPDQQALNLLMRDYWALIVGGHHAWAFQYNHAHEFRNGEMYNAEGRKYAILHQYLYQWKAEVEARFA